MFFSRLSRRLVAFRSGTHLHHSRPQCVWSVLPGRQKILGLCGVSAGFCMVFSTLSRILPKVSRLAADLRGTCNSFPEAVLLGSSKRPKVSHVTLLDSGKCRARLQSPLQLVLNQTP